MNEWMSYLDLFLVQCLIYMRRMPIPLFSLLPFVLLYSSYLYFIPSLFLYLFLYLFLLSSCSSSFWHGSSVPAGLWSGGLWVQPAVPEAPAAAPATDPSKAATLILSTYRHLITRLSACSLSSLALQWWCFFGILLKDTKKSTSNDS